MIDEVKNLLNEVLLYSPKNIEELEQFRIKYLGKKGKMNDLFAAFKEVPKEQKKAFGQALNQLKQAIKDKLDEGKNLFSENIQQSSGLDLSRPVAANQLGSRHPLSLVRNQIIEIFKRIGFTLSEGPEIEDDWHNFTALNLPEEHPARDMQDTFFIQRNPDVLLRTHTSSVQVRFMQNNKPPIRILSPGRVFRNEAISYRSHCIFHQIEGLYIDIDVSFADLKQTLIYFAKEMFGDKTEITKGTGWLEIMGCGMVDPNVLKNCGIDSDTYTGFAFGMGIERIAMLKYQIKDLRLFFENDVRFLEQFKSAF